MSPFARRVLRTGGKFAFAMVFLLAVVAGGTLMAGHTYTLPHPLATDPALAAALAPFATGPRWTLVHVLYGRCRCSHAILDEIAEGPRPPDVAEVVLAVDPPADWAARLGRRGVTLVVTDQAGLKRDYGIEAAPLLVVLAPGGGVAYSGGYTSRKQGPDIEDLAIVAALRSRAVPQTLPVYGCATARELARAIDPLGIK